MARELATARELLRLRCCLKVLKELEKTHPSARTAIERAIEKAWTQSDAERIARYAKVLDADPETGLHSDEWDAGS